MNEQWVGLYVEIYIYNVGCGGGFSSAHNGHVLQCKNQWMDRLKMLESVWIGPGLGVPPAVWQKQEKCVENNQAKPLVPRGEEQRLTCSACCALSPGLASCKCFLQPTRAY